MKIGVHYHTPFLIKGDKLYTSGLFGVFIDSLAAQVDTLYCFMHEPTDREMHMMDYELQSSNIRMVSLGPHTPLYTRLLSAPKLSAIVKQYRNQIDHLIIRTPTPLVTNLAAAIGYDKTTLLLVGDYAEGAKTLDLPFWKKTLIQTWTKWFNNRLAKLISRVHVVSNSEQLREKYLPLNPAITIVKTTTLSSKSFYNRKDTCTGNEIKLLYTGRIDLGKGLLEMVEALKILRDKQFPVSLSIAGWDDSEGQRTTEKMMTLARSLGVDKHLHLLGKKKVGDELNAAYRDADIYLLCSQLTEGFPRTIWEALANSLPVVATKVGSIPYFLTHDINACLIEPQSVQAIADGIERLINNPVIRQKLIAGGLEVASENTLENQARLLLGKISGLKKRAV